MNIVRKYNSTSLIDRIIIGLVIGSATTGAKRRHESRTVGEGLSFARIKIDGSN